MLGQLGLTELFILLGVVLLLFGARRIPDIGRGLGQGIANFLRELRAGVPKQGSAPELRNEQNRTQNQEG